MMKRFLSLFLIIIFSTTLSLSSAQAGVPFDNKLGHYNFAKATEYIVERYDKEADLADLYGEAWASLKRVLPVTGEILSATHEPYASTKEITKFYASQIETSITQSIKERPDDATPTVIDLWNAATNGLVKGLHDPFSQYLPPEQHQELQRVLSGESDESHQFYGVGISVDWDTKGDLGVLVIAPLPGTPAERNNIEAGDIIVGVNGESLSEWEGTYQDKLEKAIEKIKGEEGTEVTLTIKKLASPEPIDVTLEREPIDPDLHLSREMLDDEVGYIRLYSFYQNSVDELRDAMRYLKLEGMKKLIFDLRYNPGGYLSQAVEVANLFLEEGELITYTDGRTTEPQHYYAKSSGGDDFDTIPMVILLNEFSASASEVVTGALRDNNRAVVVGQTSFGKGSVQEVFPLRGDAGLRLTVATYYTPDGDNIHEKGIKPDVEAERLSEEQAEEILEKEYSDVTRLERLMERDPQLKKAYQVILGEIKDGDTALISKQK